MGGCIAQALIDAWEFRPTRLEPVYAIALGLRQRERHRAAHRFSSLWREARLPDDVLFVSPWVYRWGLLFEYSITAYWVGEYRESIEACDRLLTMEDLPEHFREQTKRNRGFGQDALAGAP